MNKLSFSEIIGRIDRESILVDFPSFTTTCDKQKQDNEQH